MVTVEVYLDDGRVAHYEVASLSKAREHSAKIIATGFRFTAEGSDDLEWYPPHRIDKIKVPGDAESTAYRCKVRAT